MNLSKIILISHEMSYTGAPRSLLNIAKVLSHNGYCIEVYTLASGPFEKEFYESGFAVIPLSENCLDLSGILDDSIVILNTIFSSVVISHLKNGKCKVILFIREAKNVSELFEMLELNKSDIDLCDSVLCVSEYSSKYVNEFFNPHHLNILHNYIEDKYYYDLNYPRDGFIHFIVSGTYEYRKGIDIVVEAFLKFPPKLKSITKLHIVGPQPDWMNDYQAIIKKQYDDRIIEHGEIQNTHELMELYKRMNVFVIPSRDEACSLVALEGAMLGKLLIMSENVGASYLLRNNDWIYSTEDSDALCRKMCNATSRKRLLVEGLMNRKAYKRTSTEKIFTDNLIGVIDKLQNK